MHHRAARSDVPYLVHWDDCSSSSILAQPYAQSMLDATSGLLQHGYDTPPTPFDQLPLPQYLTTVDSSPRALPSLSLPSISNAATSRRPAEFFLTPTTPASYRLASPSTFLGSYSISPMLSSSPEWTSGSRATRPSSLPVTASAAASHKISMAAQLHGQFDTSSFALWPTNC